ncbi:MAG: PaaX family transcriptional regulator C-terminal domain-containing protein [Nevskia sp.]
MKPSAKKIILDRLLSADDMSLSARDAIAACGWFGISENSVRVALVRLSSDGMIEAADRGHYRLTGAAHELADDVATWRTAEQRVRPWTGQHLAIHCGALGRTDRAALRRRDRALDLLGFRELDRGLYVRPDNIEQDADAVRRRLHKLGLEREAAVFVVAGFDAARERRLRKLWDGAALNRSYRSQRRKLEQWMARADRLDRETAAREAFLVGGSAIRAVVFDPLLPEPLVDTAARHDFVETVRRFDRYGRAIWRELHDEAGVRGNGGPEP